MRIMTKQEFIKNVNEEKELIKLFKQYDDAEEVMGKFPLAYSIFKTYRDYVNFMNAKVNGENEAKAMKIKNENNENEVLEKV